MKDQCIKRKYTDLIEEYLEDYLCCSGVWSKFLSQDPNNINCKWKIDGYDYIKSKDFSSKQLTCLTDGTGERCLQCPKSIRN